MIIETSITDAWRHGDDVLGGMHRLRERLFRPLGWDMPRWRDMEFDQFDTIKARYLLGIDNGRVVAVQRNLFCDGDYMLASLFPELAPGVALPRDATCAEGTRSGVDQDLPPAVVQRWSNELLLANIEWALHYGVKRYSFVTYDIVVEKVMRPNGLPVELYGPGVKFPDGVFVAGQFPISVALLEAIRARTEISDPVLVPMPAYAEPESFGREVAS